MPSRPDIRDLLQEEFDFPSDEPAGKTLIVCSAPRTGSYELCRYLMAAGLGVPHEYFHHEHSRKIGARFGIPDPLDRKNIEAYFEALRRRRARNGIVAVNLQYGQISPALLQTIGRRLFEHAFVVHLFRPDIGSQLTSWRIALDTGYWDFSDYQGAFVRPFADGEKEQIEQFIGDAKKIVQEDAGFRELFALAGIKPYFVTTDDLFREPERAVSGIAEALGVPVDRAALKSMIASGEPYRKRAFAPELSGNRFGELVKARLFGEGA